MSKRRWQCRMATRWEKPNRTFERALGHDFEPCRTHDELDTFCGDLDRDRHSDSRVRCRCQKIERKLEGGRCLGHGFGARRVGHRWLVRREDWETFVPTKWPPTLHCTNPREGRSRLGSVDSFLFPWVISCLVRKQVLLDAGSEGKMKSEVSKSLMGWDEIAAFLVGSCAELCVRRGSTDGSEVSLDQSFTNVDKPHSCEKGSFCARKNVKIVKQLST